MINLKNSEWQNYQAQFFCGFFTLFITHLFILLFAVLLIFVFSARAQATSNDTDATNPYIVYDDEAELTQTIVYALPDKAVAVERNNKGKKYRRGISIAKVLFGEANIDWRPVYLPIRRMFSELENGNANFAYFVKSLRIQLCCITSEKPVFFMELGIYSAIGSPPFTQLTDLTNRRVIVIEEYQYGLVGQFIHDKNNNVTNYSAADHMTALSMLVAGRADYLLDYRVATTDIYEEVKKHNIEYAVLRKIELYMLLNKDYPNAKAVMRRLERIFHSIPKDILNNPCVECIAGVREEVGNSSDEP